jgi:hypothetical protein
MNNEVQQAVLIEILEELKTMSQDVTSQLALVQELSKESRKVHEIISTQGSKLSTEDIKGFAGLIKAGILRIEELISKQPREVRHEKRILLYPEGDKEYFLKYLSHRFIFICIACSFFFFTALFTYRYFVSESENSLFKNAWIWAVINSNVQDQAVLNQVLEEFKVDSIKEARHPSIKQYLKKMELREIIGKKERELEMLKGDL